MQEADTGLPRVSCCVSAFRCSLGEAQFRSEPFGHWLLRRTLPPAVVAGLAAQPPAAARSLFDGTREAQNGARRYINPPAIHSSGVCRLVARTFQRPDIARIIEAVTGAALDGTFLRLELASDVDGFWLKPHTDLGVKRFTLLCYLDAEGQSDLGTDLYAGPDEWRAQAPFEPGGAIAFIPGSDTWHGFQPRPIFGVRRSLIVNYVTDEWRSRDELAFPASAVRTRRGRGTAPWD